MIKIVDDIWDGGTAPWTTAGDWSLGTVPGEDDAVVIDYTSPPISRP